MQYQSVIEDSFTKDNVKLAILPFLCIRAVCLWQSIEKYTLFKYADFDKSEGKKNPNKL